MYEIGVSVSRLAVLKVVEGISATVAQKNAGVVDFDLAWASLGDQSKLDIWWRDAVETFEGEVARYFRKGVSETGRQELDPTVHEDGYECVLLLGERWNSALEGVVLNKVQNFFIYSIAAAWLGEHPNITALPYSDMATAELAMVRGLLLRQSFSVETSERADDTQKADDGEGPLSEEERHGDSRKTDDGYSSVAEEERVGDSRKADDGYSSVDEEERIGDERKADDGYSSVDEERRIADSRKADTGNVSVDEEERIDDSRKADTGNVSVDEEERIGDSRKSDTGNVSVDEEERIGDSRKSDTGNVSVDEEERIGDSRKGEGSPWAATDGRRHRDDEKDGCCGHGLKEGRRHDGWDDERDLDGMKMVAGRRHDNSDDEKDDGRASLREGLRHDRLDEERCGCDGGLLAGRRKRDDEEIMRGRSQVIEWREQWREPPYDPWPYRGRYNGGIPRGRRHPWHPHHPPGPRPFNEE